MKRRFDVNLKDLIAGLLVFSIIIGFGTQGFAADQYEDIIVAQNDGGEHPRKGKRRGVRHQRLLMYARDSQRETGARLYRLEGTILRVHAK